ncbi:putative bifunctional diguanylate cyclase/phosphodiesterase [Halanaerobium salsuginis]|jgi:diguanylate cyclase (GGDEF)-like protein|uniref:Diguanylate cyclase (GGDEF) domain-containing protein n=1 Tax=Halanaerobium salsuginis TaxID=29563 RepID=A0A1I4HT42_9FIRM|nr:GGDEF domain-containing phosphodiesterase [Halanaerobium salsuginis]SFL44761.1 diguanylate cyclase (GGDEF) domain-containing protein [Halanaerobium salsuginis]
MKKLFSKKFMKSSFDNFLLFENKNEKFNLNFFIVSYSLLTMFLIFIISDKYRFPVLLDNNFVSIIAQVQIIISIYLAMNISKKGFLLALSLNTATLTAMILIITFEGKFSFISITFSYLIALFISVIIYNYQKDNKSNIIELKKEKKKLQYLVYYDNLTELPNREMIIKRLDYLSSMSVEDKINFALVLIDFKNFKRVNDSLGFKTGDYILKKCAERLTRTINENDLAGRISGDEFAVIVQRNIHEQELFAYIKKIKLMLEKTYYHNNREIKLTINSGVSCYPAHGKNSKEIIKSADLAVFKAKSSLEKDIELFSKKMEKDIIADIQMEELLKSALANDEFHLLFQPQYETDGKQVRGFEALIRWHSHKFGSVSPGRFIPVAEETGLITEIGDWVFRNSLRRFKQLQANFKVDPILSINISVVQLTDPGFVERVKEIIAAESIDGLKLEFEITETLFISDQEYVIEVLYQLKQLGISIAMDDFGTGYASLSYLQHIPLDILKIDKAFIDMIGLKDHKMMVPPIIEMAHQWGIKVVAEGVETIDQLHYLKEHRCDFLQGFLLNRPLSEYQISKVF